MKEWIFPTGEYGVIVDDKLIVNWDWRNNKDVFSICAQINALHNKFRYEGIILNVPYLPYSRQDKNFSIGDCISLRLLINMLAISCPSMLTIQTIAVHNLKATIHYCKNAEINLINNLFKISDMLTVLDSRQINVVYPDKHAHLHFTEDVRGYNRYYCNKIRDKDSNIISFECENIYNKDYPTLITDDICDGGMTFIKCAESLKKQGVTNINLFVYHGFFTKGLQPLFDAGINKIFTTDSVCNIENENLIIIKGN